MAKRTGVLAEFLILIREHKAYWITPIIVVLVLLIGLVILGAVGGGAAAPFIYTIF